VKHKKMLINLNLCLPRPSIKWNEPNSKKRLSPNRWNNDRSNIRQIVT